MSDWLDEQDDDTVRALARLGVQEAEERLAVFVGRHAHGSDPAKGAHDHIHAGDGWLAPGGAGLFVAEHQHPKDTA